MGSPKPELKQHANRAFTTPWSSQGKYGDFSRSSFLTDFLSTAFMTGQSMNVGSSSGEQKNDPETWPKQWPGAGRLLRVPLCVILSTLPNWCDWWPDGYFNGPRDVLGIDAVGDFVNYYYLEQWNSTTDDLAPAGGDYSETSDFWKNFYGPDKPDPRKPPKEIYSSYYKDMLDDKPPMPPNSILAYIEPPSERFSQVVGHITNPYYKQHFALLKVFDLTKARLASLGIGCIVPRWMNPKLYQIRNFFLTKNRTKKNPAHGGSDNGRTCEVSDSVPCYTTPIEAWGPAFPNTEDPRNYLDFNANTVPFLTTTDPGFGVNMLHIYVGHPVVRYFEGNDPWTYQAWPLTPEVQFVGPVLFTVYISQNDITPFFNGRRNLWTSSGFDYGFLHHGVTGVYNWYAGVYAGGVAKYKEQFWKYRNFGTRLFTYSEKWQFDWNTEAIRNDRRHDCPATLFYFGFDFSDFATSYASTDNLFDVDCSGPPPHLAYGETHNYFPSQSSIDHAITVSYPPIQQRIEDYYNGLEPGSAGIFERVILENDLTAFNVSYEGDCSKIADVGSLVEYIKAYFKNNF